MSDADGSAAVHGGVKRQRERDLDDKRQDKRVEDVLAHTTHIVDAIAGVNTNYLRTLSDERAHLADRVEQLQALHTSDQLRQSETTTQLVYHNLKSLRGAVSRNVKDRFIDRLRSQVDQGQSEVLDALATHLDDVLQGSLTVADAQLSAERQLSATLVEQLRTYAQTLLETTKAANQRAFRAEVEAMHKDVLIAKLRSAHLFEQNQLLRHEHEVDALMRVVAQLAEKSRFVESARTELVQAKRHVRWLEQYLDLNGIIAAAQPDTSEAGSRGSRGAPPPSPNPALRQSAPHYFALKLLEHKEMTLTELVDSWQGQEQRLHEAEHRYTQMEGVVKQVQHDALVVHQRYLEEKERREIADRRITDMVRERLYPQKNDSVFQEMQRLRWAYTEVVDDAAQLAVNLKVCREELQAAQAEGTRLAAQVRQLKQDAETDQVALTIQELRGEYAERVRGLEEVSVRAQLQLTLAQQVSRQYGSVAAEATDALQRAAQTNAELSAVPPAVARGGNSWQPSGWQQEVLKVEAQAEKLVSLSTDIKTFELQHGELYEAQIEKLMEQWLRMRNEVAEKSKSAAAVDRTASSGPQSASHTLVSSTALTEESVTKMASVMNSSKTALREALLLLVASLQSTDVERSNLLDASLSDAQYVTELVKEVSAVTNERDRLRAQVAVCRDLLEKNHVTVVERALMHDVPVEDSLNVAEAAERITVLRDQLAAAKQLCDRSLNEAKQVTNEKDAVEVKLVELTRTHEVLQTHAARLADKLRASMENEAALVEQTVGLQSQIAYLVQQSTASASATEDGETESAGTAHTPPNQLSALFTTLSETVQKLEEEVRALHSARDGATTSVDDEEKKTKKDEEGGDAALLESLSRSGMMSVVRVLKEALQKAGLLKASLAGTVGAQAVALCGAAAPVEAEDALGSASVIPPPSLATQRQAQAYTAAQHAAKLAQYTAERQQMRERLQRAEQKASEMEAANQRLLAISKSVLAKQNALSTENERLRARVRELTAPPAPSDVAAGEGVVQGDSASKASPHVPTDTAPTALPGDIADRTSTDDTLADEEEEVGEHAAAPTTSVEVPGHQSLAEDVESTPEQASVAESTVEVSDAAVVAAEEKNEEAPVDQAAPQPPENEDDVPMS
ncbi:hypothetical protein ABB37_05263 [Leptomonas pyrrhocoris]|uniref:Uncharacterized protein n=1 Tax=Leptomonas pyrrhocoris TaxID=157538 RepID=A0A0N1J4R1_LEPPY|nr:hypothetical protein ABB37_05263 [Leptomonas pyrrhocoris]KPA79421.1 hypothetical protein ABB37_05263 [Leptomonas pyrrhocoris]|eukprot:XP_015657860.1 hypothetical protein ABB37_05263 [Leptomonas pyrrhocoris]